jgi:hypothetical protein
MGLANTSSYQARGVGFADRVLSVEDAEILSSNLTRRIVSFFLRYGIPSTAVHRRCLLTILTYHRSLVLF